MKNVKIFLLPLLMVFFIVSCDRDTISRQSDLYKESRIGDPPITQYPDLRVFYDNGGDNYGCDGLGGNCLPDIIITLPYQQSVIDQIVEYNGNNELISSYFEDNYSLVSEIFDRDIVGMVIEGELSISIRENSLTNINYVFFNKVKDGNTVIIYPFLSR